MEFHFKINESVLLKQTKKCASKTRAQKLNKPRLKRSPYCVADTVHLFNHTAQVVAAQKGVKMQMFSDVNTNFSAYLHAPSQVLNSSRFH